jgi:Fur family peroxide stress response transcriptional regulator
MSDPDARFEELVTKLREQDYRLTPQRIALLRLLASSADHPSAGNLYEKIQAQFPTTSPATVYKTLALLKEMGEVLEMGFSDGDNRYDGNNPAPHPHLICISCHTITDSDLDVRQDLIQDIAERYRYQIISHRLDFFGLCPKCQ